MCQKWFTKSHAGDFLLNNVPQSGRPVKDGSNQTETLIENNQLYTMWEIDNRLKISMSIKLLMEMKSFFYFKEKTIWTFGPTHHS